MKRISKATILLLSCFFLSCSGRRHSGNISITLSESDNTYKVVAEFDERKTRALERCMNKYLGNNSDMSFTNSRIDGDITLDDRTTFYIKKKSGFLKIILDKDKNTRASYDEIKAFGQELKLALKE
jgi:hypothetical protein